MKCPKCGLINPPEAQRCDCGYDFESRTVQQSYDPGGLRESWDRRKRGLLVGVAASAAAALIGLVRTLNALSSGAPPLLAVDLALAAGVLGLIGCLFALARSR